MWTPSIILDPLRVPSFIHKRLCFVNVWYFGFSSKFVRDLIFVWIFVIIRIVLKQNVQNWTEMERTLNLTDKHWTISLQDCFQLLFSRKSFRFKTLRPPSKSQSYKTLVHADRCPHATWKNAEEIVAFGNPLNSTLTLQFKVKFSILEIALGQIGVRKVTLEKIQIRMLKNESNYVRLIFRIFSLEPSLKSKNRVSDVDLFCQLKWNLTHVVLIKMGEGFYLTIQLNRGDF